MIKLGLVGVGGRGVGFKAAIEACPDARIEAVCDTDQGRLDQAGQLLGARRQFPDFERMLEQADLDAVIIGTPVQWHVPQSISALRRGLHVLSEIPAGASIEECRQLVLAARKSRGLYMLGENCNYSRENILVRELVRQGLFGVPYYAEGEYIHELKKMNEDTPWRRKWQTGINGNTYPTHSLGPILQWLQDDRVVSLCCAGSGHHYTDLRNKHYENEDTTITLCKTRRGTLIKLRLDMLSDRPEGMNNYQLQGTKGCYESSRGPGDPGRIWLRDLSKDSNTWMEPSELEDQFLPVSFKQSNDLIQKSGHGGSDYFVIADFVNCILSDRSPLVGINEAMDMTLPGLVSQQSIANNGPWIEVPDSRDWSETQNADSQSKSLISF